MHHHTRQSFITGVAIGLLALAPLTAGAERAIEASTGGRASGRSPELTVDTIVQRHLAALGGEQLLRSGKSVSFTVTGEKQGKKFTKTVHQARPNKLRVEIQSDDGPMSKGFDGKVAWVKKGAARAEMLSPEDTLAMKSHATFDEPLLDHAKQGITVKLVGKSEVKTIPAYDLEVTLANGDVEHHFLDAKSFLLLGRTFASKDKNGKSIQVSVRFGGYKKVQGRMVNHSVELDGDDGKAYKSNVSKVSYDKPIDAKLFAMPK